jgi:hypothetical protein
MMQFKKVFDYLHFFTSPALFSAACPALLFTERSDLICRKEKAGASLSGFPCPLRRHFII